VDVREGIREGLCLRHTSRAASRLTVCQLSDQGVTYQLTQGVVKNIVPAIASTNAIISGMCALEAFKVVTGASITMDNYTMCVLHPASCPSTGLRRYMGSQGIYTHTVGYERDDQCPVCSPGVHITIDRRTTLQQVGLI